MLFRSLSFIRLVTPTSDDTRLPAILAKASGFVYYVSITGITGTASATGDSISKAITQIRKQTKLPIVTGFGIRSANQAAEAATLSDGAVVGSAVVNIIAENLPKDGASLSDYDRENIVRKIAAFVGQLAGAIRG